MGGVFNDHVVRTYYVSRVVELPPLVGQAAYDAQVRTLGEPPRQLVVSRSRLILQSVAFTDAGRGGQPLRRNPGHVVTRSQRWPVELELHPWSSRRVELGFRPLDGAWRRLPPDAVVNAGHDVLAALAVLMHAWAERPLTELAWPGQPADVSDVQRLA